VRFLALGDAPRPSDEDRPENPTGSAAFRAVYRSTVRPLRRHLPGVYRRLLESSVARQAKRALLRLLGTAGAKTEMMSSEMEAHLQEEFAPTYDYLQGLGFRVYDQQ